MRHSKYFFLIAMIVFSAKIATGDIGCGTTLSSSGYYSLKSDKNCSGNWITITGNDVIIDGESHTVSYGADSSANGIQIGSNTSGVTIRNFTLTQGTKGQNGINTAYHTSNKLTIDNLNINMIQTAGYAAIGSVNDGVFKELVIKNCTFNLNPSTVGQMWGVFIDGSSNNIFSGSIYNCNFIHGENLGAGRPGGIRLTGYSGSVSSPFSIYSNTFTYNAGNMSIGVNLWNLVTFTSLTIHSLLTALRIM